jgi:hypothetical protein
MSIIHTIKSAVFFTSVDKRYIKWLTMGFFKREDVSQSSLIEWHTLIEWNEIVCHSTRDDWETSSRFKKKPIFNYFIAMIVCLSRYLVMWRHYMLISGDLTVTVKCKTAIIITLYFICVYVSTLSHNVVSSTPRPSGIQTPASVNYYYLEPNTYPTVFQVFCVKKQFPCKNV